MNQSRIVITGTIASGKSTLSSLLKEMGYFVIDSDKVNRELLEEGNINYNAIKSSDFFNEAFDEEKLNKKKLAEIIFSNHDKMLALNKLTHKNIMNSIEYMIENSNENIVFVEIPLYFSMEDKFQCDYVWLVDANREAQIKRLMVRDNISRDYALRKLESQENKGKMLEDSDVVFDNSGDIINLKQQLIENLKKLEK